MQTIRRTVSLVLLALGLYGAFIVYQQSQLAAAIVGILSLCLAIPFWLNHRKAAAARANIGKEPSTRAEHGLRQARAMAMREEGDVSGLPKGR